MKNRKDKQQIEVLFVNADGIAKKTTIWINKEFYLKLKLEGYEPRKVIDSIMQNLYLNDYIMLQNLRADRQLSEYLEKELKDKHN